MEGWMPLLVIRSRFDVTTILSSFGCMLGFWTVLFSLDNYNHSTINHFIIALIGHILIAISNVFNLAPSIYLA